jgi:xylulokinase
MTSSAFLGLDIGGTGAKAAVFDATGRLLGAGRATYAPTTSAEGYAEIPIELIYSSAREAARQAIGIAGRPIQALAVATQGQTFVPLDASGAALCPAILWYDSRAVAEAGQLQATLQAMIPAHEMPLVEPIAAAPKILWLRRHHPQLMALARRYLLLPDYFAYRLTGEAVTDPCTASTTGLFAEGQPDYDPRALMAAHILASDLARIQPAASRVAQVRPRMAEEWGLSPETQVVVGTNDQYAGALGAGNYRPGILTETTGTCLALVTLFSGRQLSLATPPGLLLGTFPIEGYNYALAYAKTAGLIVDWFRQQFGAGQTLAQLEALAAASPPGSRGVTMLPHFDGMVSPVPNQAARGAFLGLTLGHTTGDLYRAVLESIAYSLRENIELLQQNGLHFDVLRAIGGGAKSDLWLQMKADVTGLPIERPAITEAATLGAAMLAATGAGEFGSVAECSAAFYRAERVFMPDAQRHADYAAPYQSYRELYRKLYPSA